MIYIFDERIVCDIKSFYYYLNYFEIIIHDTIEIHEKKLKLKRN